MKKTLALFFSAYMLIISSCKKIDMITADDINNFKPAVTAVGIPVGPVDAKDIGPNGGNMMTADGKLELIIPAGALSINTSISIQPVTNNCPGGLNTAYRLLPDGLKFQKNIFIKIHYTENELTQPDLMAIAFQDTTRSWRKIKVENDIVNKFLTGTTNHFTDYTLLELAAISPAYSEVKVGESTTLNFFINTSLMVPEETDQLGELAQILLAKNKPLTTRVNGIKNGNQIVGTVSEMRDFVISYTAPSTVPTGGIVVVACEINLPYVVDGRRFEKMVLLARIKIKPNEHKYSLSLEYNTIGGHGAPVPCKYFDEATMDVLVKDEKVIITNIQNKQATWTPTAYTDIGNCFTTLFPGTNGVINVVSAEPTPFLVVSNSFSIRVIQKDRWRMNGFKIVCPPPLSSSSTIPSLPLPDTNFDYGFLLKDSLQKQTYDELTVTLRPK